MANRQNKIAIVGAGVIGLTTAYRLLQIDNRCCIDVYDKDEPGGGATSFAGAIDIPYYQSQFHRQLVQFSWNWFAKNIKCRDIRQARRIEWRLPPGHTKAHLQSHLLGELIDIENNSSTSETIFEGQSFVIDPEALCNFFKQNIVASGKTRIFPNTEVLKIHTDVEQIVVETDSCQKKYDHIFICLGPWIRHFNNEITDICVKNELRTKKVCAFRFALNSAVNYAVGDPINGIFCFPTNKKDEYAMSIRFDEYNVFPDDVHSMPETVIQSASQFLNRNFGHGKWEITKNCVFVDTYTKAFKPLVSTLEKYDDKVTLIAGTHGSGIRLSPGLANEAISQALSSRSSNVMSV